jgi:hypothetical protein
MQSLNIHFETMYKEKSGQCHAIVNSDCLKSKGGDNTVAMYTLLHSLHNDNGNASTPDMCSLLEIGIYREGRVGWGVVSVVPRGREK